MSLGHISPTMQTHLHPTPDLTDPVMALTQLQSLSCQSHGWLPWSKWSRCDLNCQQQRQRFCRPECTDIRDCPGGSKEVQNCQTTCRREYISCMFVALKCKLENRILIRCIFSYVHFLFFYIFVFQQNKKKNPKKY